MNSNINKHIKDHKEEINLDTPPMDAWKNIEVGLNKKKKKGFFYLPYAASIAFVVMTGGAFFMYNQTNTRNEIAIAQEKSKIGFRGEMIAAGTDYGDDENEKPTEFKPIDDLKPSDVNGYLDEGNEVEQLYSYATPTPPAPTSPNIIQNKHEYTISDSDVDSKSYTWETPSSPSTKELNSAIGDSKDYYSITKKRVATEQSIKLKGIVSDGWDLNPTYSGSNDTEPVIQNTESYKHVHENDFVSTQKEQTSTFSIDVDAASYSNVRRMIMNGQTPPEDAVRIEEMINYFSYNYKNPTGQHPFSISNQIANCPWKKGHQLVKIGIQGKKITSENLPTNNLVFLLDVSGSMMSEDKLELLKKSFKLLTDELREEDKVSIVVYAGASGLVLPPTSGNNKTAILAAINKLEAGGSTAGGEGIELAYKTAEENLDPKGNNRIILATDGDFNVGISDDDAMVRLIEKKRASGIFLTCLGFGTGNYKDSKMEALADNGNGNYSYIDNILEAKKVLVTEMGATLNTIAKDVKIQVEFNPNKVLAYRLIGYENRVMENKDFANDQKDAGELGAGHNVTALYEIVPVGVKSTVHFDNYKYTKTEPKMTENNKFSDELCTVRFRYKTPQGTKSKLIETVLKSNASLAKRNTDFGFTQAVAGFGMILKNSQHKGNLTINQVLQLAKANKGSDLGGYRAEFIKMVEIYQLMNK